MYVFVPLHVTVNYTKILSLPQQLRYCKFMSGTAIQIVRTSFGNKLYCNKLAHFPHVTHKSCIETKECPFARGSQMYSLAKQIVTTDKLVRSFLKFLLTTAIVRSGQINNL